MLYRVHAVQNFSNRHSPFVILSHSEAVAAWSGIQHVEPQMTLFLLINSNLTTLQSYIVEERTFWTPCKMF